MEKKKLKVYPLDQIKDEMIGARGTQERELYEHELQVEILGEMIRMAREKQDLTQEELGRLIGFKRLKSQNWSIIQTTSQLILCLGYSRL